MEDAVVSAPQPAPTAKQLLHKPIVKIALGMLAVSATFVFMSAKQTPTVNGREVPVPFLPSGSANLAGSVTYVRTLPNGIEFYNMDFVGDNSQQAAADKVYLVKVPSGVSPVPFERMILDSNGSTRPYYGYIYTSSNATTEIANQNAPQFATRFPGTFFASAACKAAHGGDLDSFATLNGISFNTAGATNADANGVIFQGPQLIAFVPVDQNVTLNISSFCGNGIKTTDEACDDGDTNSGDGCSATCTVESGFTCDGGSPTVCTADPVCGDGFVTQGETCDDGNTAAGDGCSATCAVESGYTCSAGQPSLCTKLCGNGTRDQGETCDDGNSDAGDGCSAVCAVESGYTCDTSTPNVCTPDAAAPVCGNGEREGDLCGNQFVDNNEECDWAIDCAGVADGQDCSCHADCTICDGNENCAFTRPAYNGETCDDGNTAAGDGCNATCSTEDGYTCDTASPNVCSVIVECGNGLVEQGEQCDDDDAISGDGCSSTCQVELGYTCDQSEPSICTPDPVCGDGFVTQGETCDDGNTAAGDGCDASCAVEAGYVCDAGQPSLCFQTCGNGVHDQGEACDDGNIANGDGCSSTCTVEAGFTCDGAEPDVCDLNPNAVCGNGEREGDLCGNQFVDNNEECDWAIDCAGVADGQQCSCHADCTICDGNEDCTFTRPNYNGETCDDGNTNAGDGCNASCDVENGYTCDTASPNVCTLAANQCSYNYVADMYVSDDGRYTSYLVNEGTGATNIQAVIFDRQTDTVTAITDPNAAPQDGVPNSADGGAFISGDGRYVAFEGITAGNKKLAFYDRQNDTYQNLATTGSYMQLSDDGGVLLYSYNNCIVAYDRQAGTYRNVAGMSAACLSGISPLVNNGDPVVTTLDIPWEPAISGNGRYAFFLVTNDNVPPVGGGPQKDIYRVDLSNGTSVVAATAQVGSHLNVTADGNILVYSWLNGAEYDEAKYNFTTQATNNFDLKGTLSPNSLDTNVQEISSDGTMYYVFGGSNNGHVRNGIYNAATQQLVYEVPESVNAFAHISGDGNNFAYVADTPGGPGWSVFVRDIPQQSTVIAPSFYQCSQ